MRLWGWEGSPRHIWGQEEEDYLLLPREAGDGAWGMKPSKFIAQPLSLIQAPPGLAGSSWLGDLNTTGMYIQADAVNSQCAPPAARGFCGQRLEKLRDSGILLKGKEKCEANTGVESRKLLPVLTWQGWH